VTGIGPEGGVDEIATRVASGDTTGSGLVVCFDLAGAIMVSSGPGILDCPNAWMNSVMEPYRSSGLIDNALSIASSTCGGISGSRS